MNMNFMGNNQDEGGNGEGRGVGGGGGGDVLGWYNEIPLISRLYLTLAFSCTAACYLDLVSPLTLYYNYDLILLKGQYWRLLSSFLFFGQFSLDFLFHMYFVVRYCRLLEDGKFRGRAADFLFMLIFGAALMLVLAVSINMFSTLKFLGQPLSFMMVYVWARSPENVNVRMGLFGVLPFDAPFLPFVLMLFSLFLGSPIEADLLGIIAGHVYYFFDEIYPQVAQVRRWRIKKVLHTPQILRLIFGNRNDE
jgi:Derlin-2/3